MEPMELIPVERKTDKSPKEMLLETFAENKEPFIVMMSKDWFKDFIKCKGVCKDEYSLDPSNECGYFVNENPFFSKIKVKAIGGWVFIVHVDKCQWNRQDKPANKIFRFS